MRKDLSDVTVVVDRSGSMMTCRADAEGGVNSFIDEQKKTEGECNFSLVQFDHEYDFVVSGLPIAKVGKYTLVPRGGTALLDAIGRTINETGERLAAMPEADRPGLVVFVIVTDGEENSSREFTRSKIKEMIEHQQEKYQWQFTFLGANQDAFGEAAQLGIRAAAVANYDVNSSQEAFTGASANVTRMRSAASQGKVFACGYTSAERKAMAPSQSQAGNA